MAEESSYSVAIRTLGTAGKKYEDLIRSLEAQTLRPEHIFVYIAEGYTLPEKVGSEVFVTCAKGMVHQRALPYDEIVSDYLLLCDDDVLFEADSVERMFSGLKQADGDAISANVYYNHRWPLGEKFIQAAFHGLYPSLLKKYAFRVRKSGYFSYCLHPRDIMETQCFAGACILVRKSVFQSISLQDEYWMDQSGYPLGEDLVFAYKLHSYGYRVLVHSNCGILHQDAQSSHERDKYKDYYLACYIRYLIWHRAIYQPSGALGRVMAMLGFYLRWLFRYVLSLLSHLSGRNKYSDRDMVRALKDAKTYARSDAFASIPSWDIKR